MALVLQLGVHPADHEDVVQEAFAEAASHWAAIVVSDGASERAARRAWLAVVLARIAARFRGRARRACAHENRSVLVENVIGADSHEGPISAREALRELEGSTSAERWRVWLCHEVDGVAVAEVARREERPVATIYNLLRLARVDLAAAMVRQAAMAVGPLVRRYPRNGRKPRG